MTPHTEPTPAVLKPGWLGTLPRLPWTWVTERLDRERNFWLVTARRDGLPQARPVWGLWTDDRLLFSLGGGGIGRTDRTDTQPASAHADSAANVVIIEGTLERVVDPDPGMLARAIEGWNAKYATDWDAKTYGLNFTLRPRVVLAWRERNDRTNADGASKWTFG